MALTRQRGAVCVMTAGHLSTCPRMLKAADALADTGYRVRVVSVQRVPWATAADEAFRSRPWRWDPIDLTRRGTAAHLAGGLRHRGAQWLSGLIGSERVPYALAVHAYSRVHSELLRAACAVPADLYYAGTTGALAAAAVASRTTGVPYGLDLEDFHSAEHAGGAAEALANRLAQRIERSILTGAVFLTAASRAMAEAYHTEYGVDPVAVHNTFPLPPVAPDCTPTRGDGLRLYWFSQTIGPGRGLEDVVAAVGLAEIAGELHLRGRPAPGYLASLTRLAAQRAPRLAITQHDPAAPDEMVPLCAGYDAGLSTESLTPRNHALCLGNKALTYILGGLAVVLTDTPGQRPFAADLGAGALVYTPGDVAALAAGLSRWARDRSALAAAKAAAWQAAVQRWHWQHPDERGALLRAVEQVLP